MRDGRTDEYDAFFVSGVCGLCFWVLSCNAVSVFHDYPKGITDLRTDSPSSVYAGQRCDAASNTGKRERGKERQRERKRGKETKTEGKKRRQRERKKKEERKKERKKDRKIDR